ncbi:MAG: OmpA family protein [Rickettsiales bacterium]|jgi:chemotaxis protein MotB|nr:OmpA family protein [Rickettsiales bacterium]
MKVREKINSWPSFVDLFSNLVVILIFLLIVFVFLWTTTSVFNKRSAISAERISELRKISAEQVEEIGRLRETEREARDLLIRARDELVALDGTREKLTQEQLEMVAAYEKKLYNVQSDRDNLERSVKSLRAQEEAAIARAAALQSEVERMDAALNAAEQHRQVSDAEFAALSDRLNKALADRVSELRKYQSQFIGEVRDAVGGMGGVDVSTDRFVISSDILFPVGGFGLSAEGKRQIHKISGVIKNLESKIPTNVGWVIRVDGHTDRLPVRKDAVHYKTNLELSILRAKEVVREFEKNGVPGRRLVPAGFGDTSPIVEGRTAKDLEKNRRIELRLTNP